VWNREIGRLKPVAKKRQLFGMLDHPKDGKTRLNGSSHLITDLNFDGVIVTGEAQIIEGTPNGDILKALFEQGATVGVSSRGYGSTQRSPEGYDVVQEDYKLVSFDFVADPANSTSLPIITQEDINAAASNSKTTTINLEEKEMTLEELKEKHPEVYQQVIAESRRSASAELKADKDKIKEELRSEFSSQLRETIEQERSSIKEQLRSEMQSDPEVAGSKIIIENLKKQLGPFILSEDEQSIVAAKDEEIDRLREELSSAKDEVVSLEDTVNQLLSVAEHVSYELYAERQLSQTDNIDIKESVLNMLGDFGRFGSLDELKEAMASALDQVADFYEEQDDKEQEINALKREVSEAKVALDEAKELAKDFALHSYFENKASGDPRIVQMRKLFEEIEPETEDDVDALIVQFQQNNPLSREFDQVSASLGYGKQRPLDEGRRSFAGRGQSIADVSLDEIIQLSGE
jgi:hypothetical protein